MAHVTFYEWLAKYEKELWVDYLKELEGEEWINRSDFLQWARDKWLEDGTYGGGS